MGVTRGRFLGTTAATVAVIAATAVGAMSVAATPQAAVAQQAGATTLTASGLNAPVEIIRDRWGINHIYAENEYDLFFAQGYAAARDRLFQFEVWRAQATGTVAEDQIARIVQKPHQIWRKGGTAHLPRPTKIP